MKYTAKDKSLALAGIFQATKMVQQIARTGMCDQDALETSINSLFKIDADSPEDVYGKTMNLNLGLRTLLSQLGGSQYAPGDNREQDVEIMKYTVGIMVLEKKLAGQGAMLEKITQGLRATMEQTEQFNVTNELILARLANIYGETVSTLKPKIIVNGEHIHLSNSDNANKIRALLLAAIRSAVLYRQCGGTRWQVLFQRKSLLENAKTLLNASYH